MPAKVKRRWRWRCRLDTQRVQPRVEALEDATIAVRWPRALGPSGRGRRPGTAEGRRDGGRRATAPPLPLAERGPFSPGRRRPAAAGSGENWETRPSHSLPQSQPQPQLQPQPQPLSEGDSKVLEAAMAAPCLAAPGPANTRTRREGDLLRRASRPAGWGRYPESLWGLRRRRTPRARPDPATGGRRNTTDRIRDVTSGLVGGAVGGASRPLPVRVGSGSHTF